jgi:cell division protein FtsL
MAKKRKAVRKTARPKARARRRRAQKFSFGDVVPLNDPLNIAAAVMAVLIVGLSLFLYQANQQTAAVPMNAPAMAAMARQ